MSEYNLHCGRCTIISNGQCEFALLVPLSPSGLLHSPESRTVLSVIEFDVWRSHIYSRGALPSPDLEWPADTKVITFNNFRNQLAHCQEIMSNVRKQRLGFKYIWIDRYCISQKDKDAESKNKQIQNMHLVYLHAQFTIIAAAGDDVTFGLPGVSGKPRLARENAILGPCLLSSIRSTSDSLLHVSKWMTRAWTFQEAVFSRRRLIFAQEQLVLQCRHTEFAEGIRNTPVDLYAEDERPLLSRWKPSISFETDDGIQGLVRAVELYSQRG
jgi:hypothetical protein